MKITSIIFALGAIVASVHAVVPGLSSVPDLNSVVAPLAGAVSKRALPAVDQVLGSTGLLKRDLPAEVKTIPVVNGAVEKATSLLPVKRGEDIEINDAVKEIAEAYITEVAKVVVEIKAELVDKIVSALKDAKVEITAELLAKITATVDLAVDAVVKVHIGLLAAIEAKIKEIIEIHLTVGVHLKDVIDAILADVKVYVHTQLEILIATIEKIDLVVKVLASIEGLIDVDVLALVKVTLLHLVLDITVTVEAVVKVVLDLVAGILVDVHIN